MKILFVAPVNLDRPSGVSSYVLGLMNGLVRRERCKAGLLTISQNKKPLSDCDELKGCVIIEGPKAYHWNPWFVDSVWLDKIERGFGRPDLVHFHDIYYPFQSALAIQMRRRGWKYIVTPHGGLQDAWQSRKFLKKFLGNEFFLNSFITRSEAVHVLNEFEAISFKKRFPRVKTFMIPNGVSTDVLMMSDQLSSSINASSGRSHLRLGFIGRLDINHKGIDILLNAVKLLQKQSGIPMEFVFVGNFRANRDRAIFKKLVSSLEDPGKVIYVGPLIGRDKWEMLASFDVFVHTSRYEGMPGSVIEAMAFCKPCLVTSGTNMQDIIQECQGGYVVENDAQSIAGGLIKIMQSKEDLLRRGRNAQEYVRKHLTWDIIACDYAEEIQNLLKQNSDFREDRVNDKQDIVLALAPLHSKLLEIVMYIDSLCKEYDIAYVLAGGSVLGAIRHQGFIPWDDDLDIFMTHDNYRKFIKVCRGHLDRKRFYLQEENTEEWPLFFTKIRMNNTTFLEEYAMKNRKTHRGIFVDIFPLDNASDNNLFYFMQYVFSKLLIARGLGERGYSTHSNIKKLTVFFSRIFIRGFVRRALIRFIRSFNAKETKKVGSFFGKGNLKKIAFPKNYLGRSRYVKFESTFLPVPEKAEEYLSFYFGNYMKIPEKISLSHMMRMDLNNGDVIE